MRNGHHAQEWPLRAVEQERGLSSGGMRLDSRRQATRLACSALLLLCNDACDPKAGFESAAGAIDPNQKSYVDGPGSRLAAGPFNTVGLDFDLDTDVHLLARRRDDLGTSMTLFGPSAQNGCTIAPNTSTWFASKPATKPYRLLPYLESRAANGLGTLRFSSVDCKVEPYTLDNALGPIDPPIDRGFLVRQGSGLVLADPWNGTTEPIVSDLRRLILVGSQFLVWGDAQLITFDNDLNVLGRFGNHVTAITDLDYGAAFAVEDDDGLHSLILDWNGPSFSFDTVDAEACALGPISDELGWVTVHSPCSDGHLLAESIDLSGGVTAKQLAFGVAADSRFAKIAGANSTGAATTLLAYYLEDVDASSGLGTLFAVKPDGEPLQIGVNAALERAISIRESATWAGVALVDVQAGLGRLVRWAWDGTEETLAENVDQASTGPGLLANYDGHAGDVLSLDIQGNVSIVENGAPPFNTTARSNNYTWALRLEHFDGVTGDLALAQSQGPGASFETVARGVPVNQYQFMTVVPLPGFAYIGDYDEQSLTGTLFVQNLTLGSTLTVAEHVSDFIATNYPLPGILYAVPVGQNAGLWFARAK
jgi:hypothetical protein